MATQQDIPLAFHPENPVELRQELERLAATLRPYFSALTGRQAATVVLKRFVNRPVNDTTAAFGEVSRVALVEGQSLRIALPRPDPQNAGLLIGVRRSTTTGNVFLSAPGCTINGLTVGRLINEPSLVLVEFDGENYYATPGGVTFVPEGGL